MGSTGQRPFGVITIQSWVWRLMVLWCLAWCCSVPTVAAELSSTAPWPGTVEAARTDWNATAPPQDGWHTVTLPDDWSKRWPQFDGVVWYRLHWNIDGEVHSTHLLIEYLNMAGVISVNGVELQRDAHLTEPLSRMWNRPRHFVLAAPLLHQGENAVLIRVAGMAAYEPGLGPVHLGAAEPIAQQFEAQRWLRYDVKLVSMTTGLGLCLGFLFLWLMHRRHAAWGWFAAHELFWSAVAWNELTTTTWPLHSTDAFEAVNSMATLLFVACYGMFVLRFCGCRWPRREGALWTLVLLGCVVLALTPHHAMRPTRDAATVLALALYACANLSFLALAWRHGGLDQRLLSLTALVALLAGLHDTLVLLRVIPSNLYYAPLTQQVNVVAVAIVLAWQFVGNLRRIEGFNAELQRSVAKARTELGLTLARQHDLEMTNVRLNERVNLAHDLHDGFGGLLMGHIAALEQAPAQLPTQKALNMMRNLRDDLRLIIDTASAQDHGDFALADLLAPLRYRTSQLFEAHDINIRWQVDDLQNLVLDNRASLDLLRILQEALSNVFKHSQATQALVELHITQQSLEMEISDNGIGMTDQGAEGFGTGLRSMHLRAKRLNAQFTLGSASGGTVVRLRMPLPLQNQAHAMQPMG